MAGVSVPLYPLGPAWSATWSTRPPAVSTTARRRHSGLWPPSARRKWSRSSGAPWARGLSPDQWRTGDVFGEAKLSRSPS